MTASQLDNRTVQLSERSAFWRQGVEDMFHVDSETTQVDNQALETVLQRHDIGHLAVVTLRGSAQQVVVRDWSRARAAHVLIPQTSGGFIETSGVRQTLQAGRVYLVNARGPVLIQTTDRFEHLVLFLPLASSELARMFIASRDADSLILNGGTAATLAGALRALLENAPAVVATSEKMVARSITDLFHATLMEAVGALDVSVQMLEVSHRERIRQHVHAALGNPDLSVESIAAEVGLSPRRIHKLFANTDMTLMRWVWSERLAQCHARLLEGAATGVRIGELAYEWGFSDPGHFSRAFRQRYGASPSQLVQRSLGKRAS